MRILIIFDHISDSATPDQADALVQARAVSSALEDLGHEWMMLGVTLDLDAARAEIQHLQPDIVFNLVESLGGHGRLIHVVPSLLDAMNIPYTGAKADAQFITSHKPLAKQLMQAANIDTPAWAMVDQLRQMPLCDMATRLPTDRWLIKSMWEHASVGLDDDSLIDTNNPAKLFAAMDDRLDRLGGDGFAEAYIDGREFNLALLGDGAVAPQVLPPAEIVFQDYEPDRPRIVNYRCKWDESSFEYQHTLRRLNFAQDDALLLAQLQQIALQCWEAFDLRGYARVDFRVDHAGRPWVLEINTNPCLSPDAGFAAALRHANMQFTHAIDRILRDTLHRLPVRA